MTQIEINHKGDEKMSDEETQKRENEKLLTIGRLG